MEWSPQNAMKAYLQTLHLVRKMNINQGSCKSVVEPKCMEFISAMAAGKQARLMVEITSQQGITPLTIALAVAAKQTGGRLVCIHTKDKIKTKTEYSGLHLEDVIEFVYAADPCQVIKHYKNIDFAVIDCKIDAYMKLLKMVKVSGCGSVVVANNVLHSRDGKSIGQVFKEEKGVESVSLLIGEGMELTRIGSYAKNKTRRRCNRFHVTFEN